MGTNYYLIKQEEKICKCCGRGESTKELHIGKSSGGWCFSLHVIPDEKIYDLSDWVFLFNQFPIKNEYGEKVTQEQMINIITEREWGGNNNVPSGYFSHEEFHQKNHSLPGPKGLVRHKIGGYGNCISHGSGTWDLCIGEFS